MNRLIEALHSGRVLVMDGAMGTELQRLGLRDDECSALWNITHPEQVAAVHRAYREAGAEVLLTNTFLARSQEHWEAAFGIVRIFRETIPLVLADIGPLATAANLDREHCAAILARCRPADGVLFETLDAIAPHHFLPFASINHDDGGPNLPLLVSFTFRHTNAWPNLRQQAARCYFNAKIANANALGANCGRDIDMDDLLEIIRVYREHTDLPLFVRPNAGTPKRTASGWEYPRSPDYMADKLWPLLEAGVTMVGGCCGTTPAHIAAFRRVVDEWNAKHV